MNTFTNYINLQNLIREIVINLLIEFKRKYKAINNIELDESQNFSSYFINRQECNWNKSQKDILKNNKPDKWDFSLISKLFLMKEYYDVQVLDIIEKVREIRNYLAHSNTLILQDDIYIVYNNRLIDCLLKFGYTNDKLNKIKIIKDSVNISVDQDNLFKSKLEYYNLKESGEKLINKRDYEGALKIFNKALSLENISIKEKSQIHFCIALNYLKKYDEKGNKNDLDNSLKELKFSLYMKPDFFDSIKMMAEIYFKKNKLQKSLSNYLKCLSIQKDNEELKSMIALIQNKIRLVENDDNFDPGKFPKSYEEINDEIQKDIEIRSGIKFNHSQLREIDNYMILNNPSLQDVFKGHEYRDGSSNLKQDYHKAALYYSKGFQKNNPEAMYNLALLYMDGRGVKVCYKTAIQLLERAANMDPFDHLLKMRSVGVSHSQHVLGTLYSNGEYVEKNIKIAIQYYKMSADNGNGDSANNLGLIYLNGTQIKRDLKKAEDLIILAHSYGSSLACHNLVDVYIAIKDPESAIKWHEISLNNGLEYSIRRDKKIRQIIKDLFDCNIYEDKKEFNKVNDIVNNNDFIDENEIEENFFHFKHEGSHESLCILDTSIPIERFPEKIIRSEYVLKVREATFNFGQSIGIIKSNTNMTIKKLEMAVELISKAIKFGIFKYNKEDMEFIDKLENNLNDYFNSNIKNKNREFDLDARIVMGYICRKKNKISMEHRIFIKNSLLMYPNNKELIFYDCMLLNIDGEKEKALKILEKLYKNHPDDFCLLITIADIYRTIENNKELGKYKTILEKAPKEHLCTVDAYYGCSNFYFVKKDFDKSLYYYKLGLESEKDQIECFLPYNSPIKEYLSELFEPILKLSEVKNNLNKNGKLDNNKNYSIDNPDIFNINNKESIPYISLSKKDIFIRHRDFIYSLTSKKYKDLRKINLKLPILDKKNSKLNKKSSKIYLNQIDTQRDYILEGNFLEVMVLDLPNVWAPSVHLIVEDEKNNTFKVCVYNMNVNPNCLYNLFRPGCVFKIFNPYMRLANDGYPMIKVNDPGSYLEFIKYKDRICNVCGKEYSNILCKECKISYYCSVECQTIDKIQLRHELICSSGFFKNSNIINWSIILLIIAIFYKYYYNS